ncbi:MAG: ABC transporter permease [Verrucomicrobiota bacterium]|nr:ABC transporter permease [Verrucomicrobiota bacterium]
MSRLPFEAFLALRYLRPRRTFVSVITVISIIGVTLGVAVLIVVISVMSGFDREWREKILGFNAHMKVMKTSAHGEIPMNDFAAVMKIISSNTKVKGVSPYIRGQVLVKNQPEEGVNPKYLAPVILGIDPESIASVSVLPTNIISGEFNVEGNGLLAGKDFARALDLKVGDRVAVYSPGEIQKMEEALGQTNEFVKVASEYVLHGIFDVGFSEYNSMFVIVSLENAQELWSLEESVHGLQITLHDPFLAEQVRAELMPKLGKEFFIVTWPEESPQIFSALKTEKNMMFFLLFFIMIVAGFGIVNCQITFVVQKTREIGILKALGANNRQVLWLFLSQSVVVGILGVGLGLGLAILSLHYRNGFLSLMNRMTGFELLPASIYQIYNLPAAIEPLEVLIICGTALFTCVLAGLFPAWKASRLQPVEALRYE